MRTRLVLIVWFFGVFGGLGRAQFTDSNWWKVGGSISVPTPTGVPVGGGNSGGSSRDYERSGPTPEERAAQEEARRQRRERAEQQRREKQLNQDLQRIARDINRLARPLQVQVPPATGVVMTTHGADYFMQKPEGTEEMLVVPYSGVRTPPSKIPVENLRRAGAIAEKIRTAAGDLSDADAFWLASQMAQAMEGAALSVEISEGLRGSEKEMRQVAEQAVQVEKLSENYGQARTERLASERRLLEIANAQKAGKTLSAEEVKERDGVLANYRRAYQNESRLKDEVARASGLQVKIIMH